MVDAVVEAVLGGSSLRVSLLPTGTIGLLVNLAGVQCPSLGRRVRGRGRGERRDGEGEGKGKGKGKGEGKGEGEGCKYQPKLNQNQRKRECRQRR